MAGNRKKDLMLQWKNLFHLLPPLKLQWQNRKRDGGGVRETHLCSRVREQLSLSGSHTVGVLPFSSGVRENKRPVSVLLVQWFLCLKHPTLWQICSWAVPAARLAPLQPGQQLYSSLLQGCMSKLSTLRFKGSISFLLLQRCRKIWKKKASLL